jgi:predicted phosphodiesterase
MRLAVISDIHANLEAFSAVLRDLKDHRADKIFCLGDTIGYGPDPNKCLDIIREKKIPSVLGNHEVGAIETETLEMFNFKAGETLRRTRSMLSPTNLEFCRSLPRFMTWESYCFVHGYPPDSVYQYLFAVCDDVLRQDIISMKEEICFMGHTHLMEVITVREGKLIRFVPVKGLQVIDLDKNSNYFVNVGSVGQPRDGDNRAKYVIFDTISRKLEFRFIPYNFKVTMAKIRELGFPETFALRLQG